MVYNRFPVPSQRLTRCNQVDAIDFNGCSILREANKNLSYPPWRVQCKYVTALLLV